MPMHDDSPAYQLDQAIKSAFDALMKLKRIGVEPAATAPLALAVLRAHQEFKKLPRRIADGRNRYCRSCPHAGTEIEILYGQGRAATEIPTCELGEPLGCPLVKAAGFLTEADLATTIPQFLRKQAC